MKKFLLLIGVAVASLFAAEEASAQIKVGEGQISVALESNNSYYAPDKKLEDIGLVVPEKRTRGRRVLIDDRKLPGVLVPVPLHPGIQEVHRPYT